MWHNIDLAYTYQKLQADDYLQKGNYADQGKTPLGPMENKITLNTLYVESQYWKEIYSFMIVLGIMIFSYTLNYIGKTITPPTLHNK